jgi:drug/metabolite transporter (DMT)-like permease
MPVLFLILACALWGLSFPLMRALQLEQASRLPGTGSGFFAVWMQMARFGTGALLLLPFAIRGGIATRLEIRQGLLLAFWGGTGMALQADGLAHTEASTSAFLTQAYCVILPLIACAKLRRAPEIRIVISTLFVMAGCALLSGLRPGDLRTGRGEAETLLAALLFTFQILTLENPRYSGNRGLNITFVMCLGIFLIFLPFTLVSAPFPAAVMAAGASWPAILMILALALFCSLGAFLLMNHWQPRISATEAGLIYTTEPVFTAIYVLFLPGWISAWAGGGYANESFSLVSIIGGGLIVAANVILHLKRAPHPPAIAPAP